MPLRDHFASPLREARTWSSIPLAWVNYIMEQLNESRLPDEYVALPSAHLGGQAQIDVATARETSAAEGASTNGNGGTATAIWAPPAPTLVLDVDFAGADLFEVEVRLPGDSMRLVAAIEVVSPSNKDRPSHRGAFIGKCASLLQQGVSVIVLDVVTERSVNLHAELMELLGWDDGYGDIGNADLYAVAYRTAGEVSAQRLEMWSAELRIGEPLPTLPLWIAPDLSVPVDFETSYNRACEKLRISDS